MIKAIAFVFFLSSGVISSDLKKVREHYSLMSTNKDSVEVIMELSLKSKEIPSVLKKAYFAAAQMSSAQFKSNPIAKINAFNTGKNILEAAINADTTVVETRYIRYTIQQNSPSFLGYNKSCLSDKTFLVNHLSSIKKNDPELFSSVYAYLLTYCKLSESEKTIILK